MPAAITRGLWGGARIDARGSLPSQGTTTVREWSPTFRTNATVRGATARERWPTGNAAVDEVLSDNDLLREVLLMNSMVDSLFDQYDRGRITRHVAEALAALVLPDSALAQDGPASGSIVRGLSVNHVSLTVSDVPRSWA